MIPRAKRLVLWTPVGLALLLFLGSTIGIAPWTPLNCRYEDVDIRSGRIRHTRYLLFCRISDRIVSTVLSEALLPTDFDAASPDWRRVNTLSPGVPHSPTHTFGGAISQMDIIATMWKVVEFTPAARRESALRLLTSWQRGEGARDARPYVNALLELTGGTAAQPEPIGIADLPPAIVPASAID